MVDIKTIELLQFYTMTFRGVLHQPALTCHLITFPPGDLAQTFDRLDKGYQALATRDHKSNEDLSKRI